MSRGPVIRRGPEEPQQCNNVISHATLCIANQCGLSGWGPAEGVGGPDEGKGDFARSNALQKSVLNNTY